MGKTAGTRPVASGPDRPAGRSGARDGRSAVAVDAGDLIPPSAIPGATRVLIVDDHRAFAEALAVAIDGNPDLVCVGTPTTIGECLAMVEQVAPDVVLLDIYLPDGDGIEAIPAIRARHDAARILVMTGYTDVEVMARAASAGASGFLPKENSISAVLAAVRAAGDGRMLVDGSTLAAILGRVGRAAPGASAHESNTANLTRRERDVLNLMGQGLDPHAVAGRLGITLHTCRGYQKSILAKLDAHSQLEAVVVAARRGLIARLGR
jgi:Response regulator containing a CheY-like receiver domain and an HTH DNA-binding domain